MGQTLIKTASEIVFESVPKTCQNYENFGKFLGSRAVTW